MCETGRSKAKPRNIVMTSEPSNPGLSGRALRGWHVTEAGLSGLLDPGSDSRCGLRLTRSWIRSSSRDV